MQGKSLYPHTRFASRRHLTPLTVIKPHWQSYKQLLDDGTWLLIKGLDQLVLRRFGFKGLSAFYDEDDEYTIQYREYLENSSNAITLDLSTEEPDNSLSMGDEHLSTISETELDNCILYGVENLVSIPNSFLGKVKVHIEGFVSVRGNVVSILEGFTDEPPLEENDDLFDLESKKNEWNKILYDAPIDDLIFDPGGDIDEIDSFLDIDISTDIEYGYHDLEGDILYLESLLSNDTILSLPPEVFLDRDPRSLRDINDLKIMVKVFDPGIHETIFSPTYVSLPFEDRHYLSFTYVIRIFLPYFTYPVNSSLPLSSGSEDIIFDPGIPVFHFSSLKPVAYEFPMEVCSST
ncbi:hypothetical protein Tco_0561543 [Tanacetum coccineum]